MLLLFMLGAAYAHTFFNVIHPVPHQRSTLSDPVQPDKDRPKSSVNIQSTNGVLAGNCYDINWATWSTFSDVTSTTGTVIDADGSQINITMTANYTFGSTPSIYTFSRFSGYPATIPNNTVPKTTWAVGAGGATTMCFSKKVTNPVLLLSSLGSTLPQSATLDFSLPYVVLYDGGGMVYDSSTKLTGTEGYAIIMFPGEFTCVTINSSTPENYTNLTWGIRPQPFTVNITDKSSTCGSTTVTASGGVTYKWDGGDTPNQATNTFHQSGTYLVTVTNAAGCVTSASKTVVVNTTITPNISSFKIPQQSSSTIIDEVNKSITLTMPAGTNLTALTPALVIPGDATVTPASGSVQNFTGPVSYTVANGCSSVVYKVTVLAAKALTTCSGATKIISGDAPAPAGTFSWQVFQGGTWVNAPGTINNANYQTSGLFNNTSADVTFIVRRQTTGPGGAKVYDSYYDVTVQPVVAIANNTLTPPTTSFCSTGDPALITGSTPTGGNGTYTYQWQNSTNNINFTNIGGAISKDYDPPVVNTITYYRRTVTSGVCNVPLTSNVITITVIPATANNAVTAPALTSFCSTGDPAIITGSTPSGGNGTFNYQWQSSPNNINFTDIAGATAKNIDPPGISSTTYYRRTVTSGACTVPLISNTVTINIIPAIANNTITAPAIAGFCSAGDPTTITGSVPSGGNGTYNYQWQRSADNVNFTDIGGAASQSFDPPTINGTTYYRRTVTSGICSVPLKSNVVTITVTPVVANNVITAPLLTTFCSTGDPNIITGGAPSGGDGVYIYKWQRSTDNVNFTDISGAASQNFDPPAISATTYYRRSVISGSCTTPLISNVVKITIQPAIANNTITAPAVTDFCSTGNPGVITGGVPTGGSGAYAYQWQSSADNVNFAGIGGAISKDFDPPVANATIYYRRTVTSGTCTIPLISNVVIIKITSIPATPVPVNATVPVCSGGRASLSVTPRQGITYDWYDSAIKTTHLFTGDTYLTGPLTISKTYYVEATNGLCTSPSLANIRVNVNAVPVAPTVVKSPVGVCSGSTATISIAAPQAGFTYNWYTTATNGNPVFTGTDLVLSNVTVGNTYYVDAANSSGCVSLNRTPVNVTVNALPQLTVHDASICPGTSANLTASSTDQNAVIKWYASATGGNSFFTGNSYATPALNSATTYYTEAVNNITGCVSATRTPIQARILQHLAAPVVSVSSSNISGITFQWIAVTGAAGYQISIDNGQTFADPSSGSNGLTHTVAGLRPNQSVTITVRAVGALPCQLSGNSTGVTGSTVDPLVNQIFVANAFTPNGDGRNDVVYVHSSTIKSLKFYVYDQWGELLYTSVNQNNGWDGTYKGKKEPVGVYVYYVEAMMFDGHQVNKKGTVTLIR